MKPDPILVVDLYEDEHTSLVDELLRRELELRETNQRLRGSVAAALALAGVDDELAAVDGLHALARVLVHRAEQVPGIDHVAVYLDMLGERRTLASSGEPRGEPWGDRWEMRAPLSRDGDLVFVACGEGEETQHIAAFLAERGRAWAEDDTATRLARRAIADPAARQRLNDVSRRAELGAMTSAMVHELASVVQGLQGAVFELDCFVRDTATDDPELIESLDAVGGLSSRMVSLFRALRTFVRKGEANHRRCEVGDLVERAFALVRGYARARVELRHGALPGAAVDVSEPLFLHVLVNLVRNAVDASPDGGAIDLDVEATGGHVTFTVTDDGPGVDAELEDVLFEPFVTTKPEHHGSGLGLAISAHIVRDHGGLIEYERAPGRGARFRVTLPASV